MSMINVLDSDLPKTRQERQVAEAAAAAATANALAVSLDAAATTQQAAAALAAQAAAALSEAEALAAEQRTETLLADGGRTVETLGALPLDAAALERYGFVDEGGHVGWNGTAYLSGSLVWKRAGGTDLDVRFRLTNAATDVVDFAGLDDVVAVVTPGETLYYGRATNADLWELLRVEVGAPTLLGGAADLVLRADAVAAGAAPFDAAGGGAEVYLSAPGARASGTTSADHRGLLQWLDDGGDRRVLIRSDAVRQTGFGIERHFSDTSVRLYKVAGGAWTQVASGGTTFTLGQTYEIEWEAVGNVYRVWVDGVLEISYTDAASDYLAQTTIWYNPDNVAGKQGVLCGVWAVSPGSTITDHLDHLRRQPAP